MSPSCRRRATGSRRSSRATWALGSMPAWGFASCSATRPSCASPGEPVMGSARTEPDCVDLAQLHGEPLRGDVDRLPQMSLRRRARPTEAHDDVAARRAKLELARLPDALDAVDCFHLVRLGQENPEASMLDAGDVIARPHLASD